MNASIAVTASIMRVVLSSASEAELGALFLNARKALPLRTTLIELGHPQPPTRIKTDNSTANGIVNGTIKPNRTKAMDMRFFWLCCRKNQKQFKVYWEPGVNNFADYFTKHHSPAHHKRLRPIYLHEPSSLSDVQGCIRAMGAPPGRRAPASTSPRLSQSERSTLQPTSRAMSSPTVRTSQGMPSPTGLSQSERSISRSLTRLTQLTKLAKASSTDLHRSLIARLEPTLRTHNI